MRALAESDLFLPDDGGDDDEAPDERQSRASWPERAGSLGAKPMDSAAGIARFTTLWAGGGHLRTLTPSDVERLAGHLDYVTVPADAELIVQDELGDFLLLVLDGRVAVERLQAGGHRTRLGEARAGDLVGEMSLLDAGTRFSTCRTLVPTSLAVIDAARLDAMIESDPRLGVALLAALSRRLSLRLRKVSARLSALLSEN